MYAHEDTLRLTDPAFFVGFVLTCLSWLATSGIGFVHVMQFVCRRARETRLKVAFLLVIILPMAFIWTWAMKFFGSLILDCPWETAILLYEPISMFAFLHALYRLAGGESSFIQKLGDEPPQNFFFSCIPENILGRVTLCSSGYLVRTFSKNHIRYAKHATLVAAIIKYAYAVVLWVFYRSTDILPEWVVQVCRVINTVATMVSFHGLLVVVNASDRFLEGHDIHLKFWTLKATVLLVLVQGMVLNLMAKFGWLPIKMLWGEVPEAELDDYLEGSSMFLQGMLIAIEMPVAQGVTLKYWRPWEVGICQSNHQDLASGENSGKQPPKESSSAVHDEVGCSDEEVGGINQAHSEDPVVADAHDVNVDVCNTQES